MGHYSLVYLLALLVLSGCVSSEKRRAMTLMEGQAYAEAAEVYQLILANEPSDAEAIVGLKKAREKTIDTKLIEIRMSRMAGNSKNSTDSLLGIYELENKWSYYPDGKVAFTQEEETEYAIKHIGILIKSEIDRGHPLVAKLILDKYSPIFRNQRERELRALRSRISVGATKTCGDLERARRADTPYYNQFARKFCEKWSIKGRSIASVDERGKDHDLYSGLDFNVTILGLPDEVAGELKKGMSERFRKSAWFNPNGKAGRVLIGLKGSFIRKIDSQLVPQVHAYSVKIPYTAYVPEMRTRQVPYQTTEYTCAYINGRSICGNVPATAFRTEYYTVTVPVTRYREEPRTYNYAATQTNQSLIFLAEGYALVDGKKIGLSINETSGESGIDHDISIPDIGLSPAKSALTDPLEWLKEQMGTLADHSGVEIDKTWSDKFCKWQPGKKDIAATGEQALRCLHVKNNEVPDFVEKWMEHTIGVNTELARQEIAFDDL